MCTLKLEKSDLEQLSEAIEDQYYFEFILDELPIRNFVGHVEEGRLFPHTHKVFIWTHYHFTFEYNDKQIISANVSVGEGGSDVELIAYNGSDVTATVTGGSGEDYVNLSATTEGAINATVAGHGHLRHVLTDQKHRRFEQGTAHLLPTPGAVSNALARIVGAPIRQLPMTAERVWEALQAQEGGAA